MRGLEDHVFSCTMKDQRGSDNNMYARKRSIILSGKKKRISEKHNETPVNTHFRFVFVVTSINVEFHRRDLSSTAVPLMLCRGHLSSTHLSSSPHVYDEKSQSHVKDIFASIKDLNPPSQTLTSILFLPDSNDALLTVFLSPSSRLVLDGDVS